MREKRRGMLVTAVLVAGILQAAPARGAGDERAEKAELSAFMDAFAAAWTRQDSRALAELWSADGTLVTTRGETVTGRDAIEKAYARGFAEISSSTTFEPLPGYQTVLQRYPLISPRLTLRLDRTLFESRERARVEGAWEVENVLGPDGTIVPYRKIEPEPGSDRLMGDRLHGNDGRYRAMLRRGVSGWRFQELSFTLSTRRE